MKEEKNNKNKNKNQKKERKKAWQETTATVEEIQRFLEDHVMLRYNVVTRRVESLSPSPSPIREGNGWEPVTDRLVNSLWTEMSRDRQVRVQDIYRVLESDFVPEYHPFRFYLDSLPPWNGKDDYILELSSTVFVQGDVEEQMRFYEYLKKWLVAMVAAWIDDTVVNNVILVLIGPQGSYKTTWFQYLLPPPLRQGVWPSVRACS